MSTLRLLPLAVCLAALSSGCKWLESLKPRPPVPTTKLVSKSGADLVAQLNRQASYVQTIRYDSVSLKAVVPDVRWVPSLNSGVLVCGKDRNFRLQAGLPVGGDQIDVGSNPREMWMYVKQPEPTYLVCSYADFPRVQGELPVPFEPDWVLQALGLVTYPDRPNYESKLLEGERLYRLSFDDRSATGQPLKKVIDIAGDPATGTSPSVRRHAVYALSADARRWEMQTVADIKQAKTVSAGIDPTTGQPVSVQVPTHLVLEWPKQKVRMELRLGDIRVNDGRTPAAMFTRPPTIGNVSPINLADYRQPVTRGAAPRSDLPPPLRWEGR